MFEYEIRQRNNYEIVEFTYGLNERDMWKRYPQLNPEEWQIIHVDYID